MGIGGGWPASSMCVLTGPDGAGKDYLINLTLAQQQRIYGDDFACLIYSTEFKFDKVFARDMAGFCVRMTKEELDSRDLAREQKNLPPFTEEERARYSTKIGQVVLVDGVVADDGLDIVLDAVHSNEFQVVVINSLGVLQTAAKEEKDSLREHAIQANEAQLLSRFMPHLFMLLNRDDEQGNRNQTLVLATNQVRSKRDLPRTKPGRTVPDRAKVQPASGSWALKHGKAVEVEIHKGMSFIDKELSPPMLLGREINWEVTKGKLGTHDGIRGSFDFWFDEGVDILTDLINTATTLGVIEKGGAWYSYQHGEEEIKAQGERNLRLALADRPEVIDAIRNECFRESEITCLYR
jgi:RecA/RadA recombinase